MTNSPTDSLIGKLEEAIHTGIVESNDFGWGRNAGIREAITIVKEQGFCSEISVLDEVALAEACKTYHRLKGKWADMTIRLCIEDYEATKSTRTTEPVVSVGGDFAAGYEQCKKDYGA